MSCSIKGKEVQQEHVGGQLLTGTFNSKSTSPTKFKSFTMEAKNPYTSECKDPITLGPKEVLPNYYKGPRRKAQAKNHPNI